MASSSFLCMHIHHHYPMHNILHHHHNHSLLFFNSKPSKLHNHHCFPTPRVAPKSCLSHKNSDTKTDSLEETASNKQEPCSSSSSTTTTTTTTTPSHNPSSSSVQGSFFASFIHQFRNGWLVFDDMGMEMLSIAIPAALALAADPLASLVDTAFVGHIGSVELAAVGVSASVFNLISDLFNVPLLNITTSFVAEEQALIRKEGDHNQSNNNGKYQSKKLIPSVSTSLALATALGVAETVALSFGSGILMNIMGIPADSPMREPAEHFLTMRAFGAPAIVISLAAQGTFRGFTDTKTPLYAIGAGNIINTILDPLLIFFFGLGIGGAAVSTVISEYLIAFILVWKLSDNVLLFPSDVDWKKIFNYLKSGGLLIGRTIAVLMTMTVATSAAAKQGPTPMAGHQICMEVWLSVSSLTDALALAGQAILAGSYSQGNYEQSRHLIYRALQFVAGSQPVNALAFVVDGLYYGVSDFGFAAYSMVLVALISSVFILVASPVLGLPGVWTGLFLFMVLRVLAGVWRLGSKSGPWDMVWYKDGAED
ncbi:protein DETOXIFICATION 44, chloroplastic isoform X2 [Arachis ipaensis]|uniref:protein DETOXIFICATION 44, chloroplastic isoform X2 n=1 Tax=Arachis ipaensis TaxID=130454 RepID=UPI000A2B3539|nr:protein DETOXIFICATION 44, chloroplastic isoform X2 [Arachis ipaensis]